MCIRDRNKAKNYSILDIELLTGKTHQIRAHLAHIGYPIIGDGKYGKNEITARFCCGSFAASWYNNLKAAACAAARVHCTRPCADAQGFENIGPCKTCLLYTSRCV